MNHWMCLCSVNEWWMLRKLYESKGITYLRHEVTEKNQEKLLWMTSGLRSEFEPVTPTMAVTCSNFAPNCTNHLPNCGIPLYYTYTVILVGHVEHDTPPAWQAQNCNMRLRTWHCVTRCDTHTACCNTWNCAEGTLNPRFVRLHALTLSKTDP